MRHEWKDGQREFLLEGVELYEHDNGGTPQIGQVPGFLAREVFRLAERVRELEDQAVPAEPTASVEEAFNGPLLGTGSGTSVVGWGPPGEESPIPPGGIVPGAYRVESVTAAEGPSGPTLNMELVGPLEVEVEAEDGIEGRASQPADVTDLMEALKASLAQDRRFNGGELAGDD
jgi:hypothetical protein